jgi:hypothetical protein
MCIFFAPVMKITFNWVLTMSGFAKKNTIRSGVKTNSKAYPS